jgi:hypothetical protein
MDLYRIAAQIANGPVTLYHRSSLPGLESASVGDTFTLKPGSQGVEGRGVYFSEGRPVPPSTAEGTRRGQETGIVCIRVTDKSGWWLTKGGNIRKFNRPRTWHTDGKSLLCTVTSVSDAGGTPLVECDWIFVT